MTGNLTSVDFNHGQATFTFDGKPSEEVRGILKRNGFRWSPSGGYWWRRKVSGCADIATAIEKVENRGRPDGNCHKCGQPGKWRQYAARTLLLCDACNADYAAQWDNGPPASSAYQWGDNERARAATQREETARQRARDLAADDFDLMNNRCL